MPMTSEQRERLIGQVMLGVSVETALECLGLTELDLSMRLAWDDALRDRLIAATAFDDALKRELFGESPQE
jgi:hypothetical protein